MFYDHIQLELLHFVHASYLFITRWVLVLVLVFFFLLLSLVLNNLTVILSHTPRPLVHARTLHAHKYDFFYMVLMLNNKKLRKYFTKYAILWYKCVEQKLSSVIYVYRAHTKYTKALFRDGREREREKKTSVKNIFL